MVSVFDYTEYRCFLKDRFSELKKKNPLFSFRSFNRLAGLKSSGFLKLVIDGKRNLADEGIHKIAKGFKLNELESKYFENLVKFNQARSHEVKDLYFRELSQNKKFLGAKPLTAAQYNLFSHWYYVAILEMIRIETKEKKNLHWLRKHLNPSVGLRQLKKAVEELKQLHLVREDKKGTLKRQETMLTTEDEVRSLSVTNFHVQMCKMATRAVLKEKGQDREFSALTIVTSEPSFQRAKTEIQKFRKRLHSILEQENDRPKTFVAHLNFHLFKLSSSEEVS